MVYIVNEKQLVIQVCLSIHVGKKMCLVSLRLFQLAFYISTCITQIFHYSTYSLNQQVKKNFKVNKNMRETGQTVTTSKMVMTTCFNH